ncbi:MAG: nucleotidyltransferase domain-containing protein [Lentisphaeria bacterium]|nr:nucleotidyltransferase domain-containing protein [Lentisphaeria bacterium]
MMLSEQDIQDIVDRVVEVAAPEKIILFGSYATGTATEDSDVDLLVVKETPLPFAERTADIQLALLKWHIPTDIVVQTPEEFNRNREKFWTVTAQAAENGRFVYG